MYRKLLDYSSLAYPKLLQHPPDSLYIHTFPLHMHFTFIRTHSSRLLLSHLCVNLTLLTHAPPHTPILCYTHSLPCSPVFHTQIQSPWISEHTYLPHVSSDISSSASLQHHPFGSQGAGSRAPAMTCVPYPLTVSEPPAPAFSWPWWYVLLGAVVAAGCVFILALFLVHRRKKETRYG